MAVAISQTANPVGVSASSNVATYSSISIGTAADDRIIVLCVGTELSGCTPNSATIDYGSGALTMTPGEIATQGAISSRVFYLPAPTGTTATFAVTFGATPTDNQNHIAVYRVVGATLIPSDTGQVADTDADPISSGAITIPSNGGIICTFASAATTVRTWTGITEDIDTSDGNFRFSTGTSTTGGTPTITVSGGNNEDATISWVTFAQGGFLIPSLYTDGDTFHTPTVSQPPGPQELTPSLYSDGDTFFTPQVNLKIFSSLYSDADTFNTHQVNLKIFPALYSDADTFFSPSVKHIIFPSLYTDADSFFSPQVNLKIFPALFTDGDVFHSPIVGFDQELIQSATFVNTQQFPPEPPVDTFWQHTVAVSSGTQALEPSLYEDADTFYTPTIKLYLVPSLYTDGDTFYSPNVIQLIKPDLYSDADIFFGPTVNQTIYPSLYSDADTFFGPTIKLYLNPDLYTDADSFFSPSVKQFVHPSLYTDADSFFSATITTGGVTLSPSLYLDTDTFFTPVVKNTITPSLYEDPDTIFSPSVSYTIYPALYSDADAFYSPTVALLQTLEPSLFTNTNVFHTYLIEQFDIRGGRFPHRNPTFRSQRMPVFAKFR